MCVSEKFENFIAPINGKFVVLYDQFDVIDHFHLSLSSFPSSIASIHQIQWGPVDLVANPSDLLVLRAWAVIESIFVPGTRSE